MQLQEAIDWYCMTLRAEGKSPRTIGTYRGCLAHLEAFARALGCTRVDQLTPDVVRAAVGRVLELGHGAPTALDLLGRKRGGVSKGGEGLARIMVTAARSLARALSAEGHQVPDLGPLKNLPQVERVQPRLTPAEFTALVEALQRRDAYAGFPRFELARDRALVHLLIEAGLRASECCGLELGHVDTTSGVVTVHRAKGRKPRLLSIRDPDDKEDEDEQGVYHAHFFRAVKSGREDVVL
jgi:site-specific recombinase XerC